jgi:predicted transcriptional regulator
MNMLVADVMTVRLFCARPDTPIKEVAQRLVRNRIGGMPVVDDGGRLKGMISESDLQPLKDGPARRPVQTAADVMTRTVIALAEVDTVTEAARTLTHHRIKRAPVLRDGRVVGIVTKSDLLRPYLRADGEIRLDVEEALLEDGVKDGANVEVSVHEGIVLLEGSTRDRRQAALLTMLARAVDGVVEVLDHLEPLASDLDRVELAREFGQLTGDSEQQETPFAASAKESSRDG